jgi:hypothetical protein
MLALMRENHIQRRWIMKTRIVLLCSVCVVLLAVGCAVPINAVAGSGNLVTQSRSVSNFNAVTLAGFGDLTMIQGDSESLTIEAEDNILPHITTLVTNGRLSIGYDNQDWSNFIRPTKPIRFNLSLKNLSALELSGAGNIQSANIKTDQLDVRVSGAGNIKIEKLEANALVATLSGAGNFDVAGNVANQDIRLTGLGNLGAGNLKSQSARITMSGAGNATVATLDSLDVTIRGVGSVRYYGSPEVTQKISGVGAVSKLGN